MRSLIITLLITATAVPALAQDRGPFGMRQRDRATQSSNDGERARPQRIERRQSPSADARGDHVRPQRVERRHALPAEARGGEVRSHRVERNEPIIGQIRERRGFARRERPVREAIEIPAVRDSAPVRVERPVRRSDSIASRIVAMPRARSGDAVRVYRDTTTPTRVVTRHSSGDRHWSNHWRDDRRYDWRRHREHNRSVFRFGSYWDPYGHDYRRFSVGYNMWPSYYQSSYWLNDPYMYRLPPAYGRYRWVRYWDDALLVDIYSGRVVDVVHDFFW